MNLLDIILSMKLSRIVSGFSYLFTLLLIVGCSGGSNSGNGGGGGVGGGGSNPPAPTLSSISPIAGPINTQVIVILSGSNFVSTSTVAVNGVTIPCTFIDSAGIKCVVPAYALALPGNANFTVTTPPPGGGTTAPQIFTAYVAIADNDIVYNAKDGLLYASVLNSGAGSGGNTVVGIDPVTGNIIRQIWVGSNPNQLALSTDGTQLFVGLDGAGAVAQVDLIKGTVVNQFSLGGGQALSPFINTAVYLAAVPGEPNSVAVVVYGSVTIYDSGVARPESSTVVGEGPLSFGPSSSILYQLNNGTIYQLNVGSTGITNATSLATVSNYLFNIQYDMGQIYVSNGQVLNASTGALQGTFYMSGTTAADGPVVSDSAPGRAFIADYTDNWSGPILAYNEADYSLTGSIPVNGIGTGGYITSFKKILRWGENGLAVNDYAPPFTTESQIFIYQSPLVKDLSGSPADLSVTLRSPATATTGTAISWVATISNNGPDAAQSATLNMNMDASQIINSVKSSQGSCGSGAEFTCNLGSMANGASATVTVSATPTTAGTLGGLAIVTSTSLDPTSTNNQSTTSTVVTGSIYSAMPSISSISPYYVQAGSSAFTLSVTGEGFNQESTINLGSTALTTTYLSANQLAASVSASEIANYGWAAVTVTNPAPGGGVSDAMPLTIYTVVNIQASGMLFEPYTQQLYATIPGNATGITGNSVATINPFTGVVGTPITVGSNPNVMAETADGNYLYIGLSGSDSLAQFNLLNQSVGATFPITESSINYPATWLSVMPGTDTTLAIDMSNGKGGIGIFDITGSTGTFRPNLTGNGYIAAFANASEFYTSDGSLFYRFSVNANGVSPIDSTELNGLSGFDAFIQIADGLVYGAGGGVINPTTTPPTQVATLPYNVFFSGNNPNGDGIVVDPSLQREFVVLENMAGSYAYGLVRYDLTTYTPESFVDLPSPQAGYQLSWTASRFGQDGLALLSTGEDYSNQIVTVLYLMRGPIVTPQLLTKNSAASLSSSSSSTIAHGSGNVLLTLTGTNLLPGVAVTWNGSYRTTTWLNSTQATAAIPQSDLVNIGSASLVATNPGASGSNALQITID